MVIQKVRKVGNSYGLTISGEELERQHIEEGDVVGIEVRKVQVDMRPEFPPEVAAAVQRSLEKYDADLRYLAGSVPLL